jgi:hypothetical protein
MRSETNQWPDGMAEDVSAWFAVAFARAALRLLADRPGGRRWFLEFVAEELAQDEQDETPEPWSGWMN